MADLLLNLYGTYTFNRDEKGRIQTPAFFYEMMFPNRSDKTNLVMTKGPDGCVYAFTLKSWNYYVDQLRNLEMSDSERLALIRGVLSPAGNCKVDSQRRVRVPDDLAEYAQIKKEVEIVGFIDRLEIWSPEIRKLYLKELKEEQFDYDSSCKSLFIGMMPRSANPVESDGDTDQED